MLIHATLTYTVQNIFGTCWHPPVDCSFMKGCSWLSSHSCVSATASAVVTDVDHVTGSKSDWPLRRNRDNDNDEGT